jgi:hypothetical protein
MQTLWPAFLFLGFKFFPLHNIFAWWSPLLFLDVRMFDMVVFGFGPAYFGSLGRAP